MTIDSASRHLIDVASRHRQPSTVICERRGGEPAARTHAAYRRRLYRRRTAEFCAGSYAVAIILSPADSNFIGSAHEEFRRISPFSAAACRDAADVMSASRFCLCRFSVASDRYGGLPQDFRRASTHELRWPAA
jgi:hypothetical protein